MTVEKPAGYHEHHRRKGDRQKEDLRGCDVVFVPPVLHDWIEKHPKKARELGLSVSRYEDPADVPIVIPENLLVTEKAEKEKRPRNPLPPRERKTTQIRTPANEPNVIDELVEANVEKHGPSMGWSATVPTYHVVVLALVKLLELTPGDVQVEPEGE